MISTEIQDEIELVKIASQLDAMVGANLVPRVTSTALHEWSESLWSPASMAPANGQARCHIVALDCGIKYNILRHLVHAGCRVTVMPSNSTAAEIAAVKPDGLMVGNGPGDPAAVTDAIATLLALLGRIPIFGICLGHQMLALAMGADTFSHPKLRTLAVQFHPEASPGPHVASYLFDRFVHAVETGAPIDTELLKV